jgi:hypothetical protein
MGWRRRTTGWAVPTRKMSLDNLFRGIEATIHFLEGVGRMREEP